MAKIEYAYYKMAIQCGINMSPSKLFEGNRGNSYFGTQRFDRTPTDRLHFHTASGLLHDNFRVSTIDYGHVMDAANRLENNLIACENVFRLAVFNVYANNMDDHSKNCAFLMNSEGLWNFAPAFDLTFSPRPGGYQSISVAGVYKSIREKDFIKLAYHFQIDKPNKIILEVKEALSYWSNIASELDINKKEKSLIENAIQQKLMH
jgi:serine/threonine-protein kinase HipA